MASGALVAAVLIGWRAAGDPTMVWKALGLLVLAGVPILPGVFNPLVRRLSSRFTAGQPLPAAARRRAAHWPGGDGLRMGLSRRQSIRGDAGAFRRRRRRGPLMNASIAPLSPHFPMSPALSARRPAVLEFREVILQQFLVPRLGGEAPAVVAVLLLRVLWTAAELVAAGVLFWLPVKKVVSGLTPNP